MNLQKLLYGAIVVLMVIGVAFGVTQYALAVHELELFELDRNALDDPEVTGDDWDTLYTGGGSAHSFTGILADIGADGGTQFQGGGSKDNNDISEWLWKEGEPLDKDDITNAYAAAYVNDTKVGLNEVGDLIIYFGLDRFAVNGSAQVGFWFLQDPNFGLTTTSSKGGYKFSGEHMDHDILVQSNFSNGGVISSITVYEWLSGGLNEVASAVDCFVTAAGDTACATVNQSPTESLWPYTPKSGTDDVFPTSAFFEGGINLSYLIPEAGCFTGFMAETRSSTPFDSRLKDFVLGEFNLCSIDVFKTGDELSKVGDDVDYTVTITNTGSITLYKDDISDTLLGAITTNGVDQANSYVTANTCGASLAAGATCLLELTREVEETDTDPLTNTVSIIYRGKADLSGIAIDASDDHSVNLIQPAIDFDKSVDADLSKVGDTVNYTLTLTNTSSADTPNLECTIVDSALGIDKDVTLASGAEDVTTKAYTIQAGDDDPFLNTASVTCSPDGFPNILVKSDSESVDLFQPSIDFDKSVDSNLSKVDDSVTYTLTLTNTSSIDTPDLECTITDEKLGIDKDVTLASGAEEVTTKVYTFDEEDADPFNNTASVSCSPVGFPNILTKSDSESVNLFQPAIDVDKTGDLLSKIGDTVYYTITLSNNSSADTPALNCTANDSLLGSVFSGVLPLGDTVINTSRTVLASDADPLVNSVKLTCSPDGFPNVLEKSDSHSTELFQPSIDFDKSVDSNLSKVGDSVTYTLTLTNTSSTDTPDLECTLTDESLGIDKDVTLASGAKEVTTKSYTFDKEDADPFNNTANVSCSPVGFPNVLTASDSESVNLFQPSIEFDKSVDSNLSKVGDSVTYTLTLTNTSSADTPDLECTITDEKLGIDKDVTLASSAKDETEKPYTIQDGDADPFINTASVSCSPDGFTNVLSASDSESVDLFQPSIDFDKSVDSNLSKVGDSVTYTLTLTNTSSTDTPDLECTITDEVLGIDKDVTLASGGKSVTEESYTFGKDDPDPFNNTASVSCSPIGFPNVLTASDSESVNLFQPSINVDKTGDALSKVGDDIHYTITLSNDSSVDTPALDCTATDSMFGIIFDGVLPSGDTVINRTHTVVAADPDPVVNTMSMSCSVAGFPNVLTKSDGHTTNLFQPGVEVIKSGPASGAVGDTVTYSFTINNKSSGDSPNLILVSVTDTVIGDLTAAASANGCGILASGGSCSFNANYTIQAGDPNPLVNVVTVLYHPQGFPNDITDSDDHSLTITYGQGCTPGFWQGGAGALLWDGIDDPAWVPFTHDTLFNTFFSDVTDDRLNDLTMFDIVGTGGGSDWARKAARDMVAAYLNESAFPAGYPAASLAALEAMWYDAVAGGDTALATFHNQVSQWNSEDPPQYCPLP
jgi:uncharacterized repeat protein (TIGR01451 family)